MKIPLFLTAPLALLLASFIAISAAAAETRTVTFGSLLTYLPSQLTIQVGDSVEWQGNFSFHPLQQVTGATSDTFTSGGFGYSGLNSSYTVTFDTAGTYYYVCTNHGLGGGTMRGSVTVVDPNAPATPTPCASKPAKPVISAPPKGTKSATQSLTLSWSEAACATSYKVEIRKGDKKSPVFKRKTSSSTSVSTGKLPRGIVYFWGVQGCNSVGCSGFASSKFSVNPKK